MLDSLLRKPSFSLHFEVNKMRLEIPERKITILTTAFPSKLDWKLFFDYFT